MRTYDTIADRNAAPVVGAEIGPAEIILEPLHLTDHRVVTERVLWDRLRPADDA